METRKGTRRRPGEGRALDRIDTINGIKNLDKMGRMRRPVACRRFTAGFSILSILSILSETLPGSLRGPLRVSVSPWLVFTKEVLDGRV
jgi:hypothetical protein